MNLKIFQMIAHLLAWVATHQFDNICINNLIFGDLYPLFLFTIINYHEKKIIIFRYEYIFIPSCDHRGRNLKLLKFVFMFLYLFIQLTWF